MVFYWILGALYLSDLAVRRLAKKSESGMSFAQQCFVRGVGMALLFGIPGLIAWMHPDIAGEKPQAVVAGELIAKGAGGRGYIELKDFSFDNSEVMVPLKNGHRGHCLYIPVVPSVNSRSDRMQLFALTLFESKKGDSEEAEIRRTVERFRNGNVARGVIRNTIGNAEYESGSIHGSCAEAAEIAARYPSTDVSKALVIDSALIPEAPGMGKYAKWIGLAGTLIGAGLIAFGLRPRPVEE